MPQESERQETVVAPPSRPEEERLIEQQVAARRSEFALNLCRVVLGACIALTIALAVTWVFFQQYTQLLWINGMILLILAGAGLYPFLYRRGQARMGLYIFLGSFLIVLASGSFLLVEILPAAGIGFAVVIIMSILLLGDRVSRWLIGACILAFAADIVLGTTVATSWFLPLNETARLILVTSFGAFTLLASAVLSRLVVLGQEEMYRRSQRANLEVEQRAGSEQHQREYLQATVQQYVEYMVQVAQGNLSARLVLDGDGRAADDPLMILGRNLNDTVASLQRIALQTRDIANNLGAAASEIMAATTQQASGASEQSAAITQASSTIDEVRTLTAETTQRAQGVAELSQRTADVSQAGQQAVAETIAGMGRIRQKVEGIATTNLALSEQAQAIGQIIATVSEIATQSNMLALNAAVEAARAGEAGAGFAVVAGEVRNLAQQSRAATVQVKEMLSEIQRGVNAAVMATKEGMKEADAGTKLAGESGLALQRLAESVTGSAQAAMQIAAAAAQQLTGMEQIASAMGNIHQVTGQTVASTQQSERAAAELNGLAAKLREVVVQQYQL